jgi:hypothetical protein
MALLWWLCRNSHHSSMYCHRRSSAYSSCHIASAVSICRHFWPFCSQQEDQR